MIIGLDMGHTVSGPNYGAVGLIKESEETRVVGNKIISYLKQLGHTVVNCTVDTAASNEESLSSRVNKANSQTLDLFVSIHFNAGGGKGTEVFTYNAAQHVEATRVLSNMNKIGFVNRGVKDGSSLYVVKNTSAKSMLVEVCFVDTQTDVDLYKVNIDMVARAITEGITGQTINNESEDEDMIADTVKTFACENSLIKDKMIEEIKILQSVAQIAQDGIATEKLVKAMPELQGHEQRGVVTVMQRILILKGMLSQGSATGIIGQANKDAINRFKTSVGIPLDTLLVDSQTWRKLLEY